MARMSIESWIPPTLERRQGRRRKSAGADHLPQPAEEAVDSGLAVGESHEQHRAGLTREVADLRPVLLDERALQDQHSTRSALQAEVDGQTADPDDVQPYRGPRRLREVAVVRT